MASVFFTPRGLELVLVNPSTKTKFSYIRIICRLEARRMLLVSKTCIQPEQILSDIKNTSSGCSTKRFSVLIFYCFHNPIFLTECDFSLKGILKKVSVLPKFKQHWGFWNRLRIEKKVGFVNIWSGMFQNGRWRNQREVKGKIRKPLVGHPVWK